MPINHGYTLKLIVNDGYLVIRNFIKDLSTLQNVPKDLFSERHIIWKRVEYGIETVTDDKEIQVPGAYSRINYPAYNQLHRDAIPHLEKELSIKLNPTYHFDRFYYAGTELVPHKDWEACEISISLQIDTTLKEPWPFYADGTPLYLNNGDAIIYKGCDIEHWREPMKGTKKDYHHQLFLHYMT